MLDILIKTVSKVTLSAIFGTFAAALIIAALAAFHGEASLVMFILRWFVHY